MFRKLMLLCTIVFISVSSLLHAQPDNDMVTDRPDFTESAVVIAPGKWQVESGATWQRVAREDIFSGAELLLRLGIFDRWELRLGLPDYQTVDGNSQFTNTTAGFKYEIGISAGWTTGLIGTLDLTNDDQLAGSLDPQLILTTGRDLPSGWSVGLQARGAWLVDSEAIDWGMTFVTGTSLTGGVATFFEIAVDGVDSESPGFLLHHGYTYKAGANVQLDLHTAIGLNDQAADFLLGTGISFRQ